MPPTVMLCPCCNSKVASTARQCPMCKMEVAKMAAFSAAKMAAAKKGIKTATVQSAEQRRALPTWPHAGLVIKVTLLILIVGSVAWAGWHFLGPKPPRYLQFPKTPDESTKQFMTAIHGGDATYDKAYFLIADSARSTKADDDRGDYVQIFHILNRYLTDEFGSDWIEHTDCVIDPTNSDMVIVTICGMETLHVSTMQQTPTDKRTAQGSHVGIIGINELDISYVVEMRQNALMHDLISGVGGSTKDIDSVLGATASGHRGPPLVRKMLILSALRDPRTTTGRTIVQANSLRDKATGLMDPVIKRRLEAIVANPAYDQNPQVREWAQRALDNKIDEYENAGAGVN